MPIYEYQCLECGEKFEKLVRSMSNPASQAKCPKCGKEAVEKLLSSLWSAGLKLKQRTCLSLLHACKLSAPGS